MPVNDMSMTGTTLPPSHDHSVRLLRFQPSSWPTKTLQFDTHDGFAFGSIPSKDRRCFTYPGLGRGPLHHGRKRIAGRDDGFCWSILVPTAVFTDSQSGLETVLSSSRSSESLLGSVKTKHPFLSLCLVLNILVSYVMNGVFCGALCSGTFRTSKCYVNNLTARLDSSPLAPTFLPSHTLSHHYTTTTLK